VHRIRELFKSADHDPRYLRRHDPLRAGNRLMRRERNGVLKALVLDRLGAGARADLLDVGCGYGSILSMLQSWGVRGRLCGVDISHSRLVATKTVSSDLLLACQTGQHLGFQSDSFDAVFAFTLFSCIVNGDIARAVAREIERVLRPGGLIFWYDFRYSNPLNPSVSGVGRKSIKELFPSRKADLQLVTLFPPLARKLGPLGRSVYRGVSSLPFLRTHYIGVVAS
jgi:ubiquinone/menaquinone biosynthesis C-methylase UbiE